MIVTGNPAEFTVNGVAATVNSLTVPFSPTQDLNGYDHPWPAGGGVNKFDEEMVLGILNADGTVSTSTTRLVSKNFIQITAETQYSMSWDKPGNSTARARGAFYDSTETFLSYTADLGSTPTEENGRLVTQFTTPQGAAYLKICMYTSYGTTYKNDITIGLYNASTNGKYYPYSNICPISGRTGLSVYRTGVNVWDEETESGYIYNGRLYADNNYWRTKNYVPVKPNTSLYIKYGSRNGQISLFDADKTYVGAIAQMAASTNNVLNVPSNCYYIKFYQPISVASGVVSINYPATDHDYHAYNGNTYAVDWTTKAGTVYGGTLDVVTGQLVVTHAIEDLGNVNWNKDSNRAGVFYGAITGRKNTSNVLACSEYTVRNLSVTTAVDMYVSGYGSYGGNYIFVRDTRFASNTAAEYKVGAAGIKVAYELATPLTCQLTPKTINLLAGIVNYVWSDTDEDITISFDVAAFIRQLFRVNGVDFSRFVERDSYATSLEPVYAETIQTMDGVNHTALLRTRGSIRLRFNPQTDSDTAALCSALLAAPCEVQYHCLQRDVDVTSLMCVDTISAQFLSRCLYLGDEWNQIESITLTEL